jgi:outer membrane autotransporter protein
MKNMTFSNKHRGGVNGFSAAPKITKTLLAAALLTAFSSGAFAAPDYYGGPDNHKGTYAPVIENQKSVINTTPPEDTYRRVIGGYYTLISKDTDNEKEAYEYNFESITTTLEGTTVEQEAIAGNRHGFEWGSVDSQKITMSLNTGTTTLNLNNATFKDSKFGSGEGEYHLSFISAGDHMKDRGLNYGGEVPVGVSNITNANLNINGGNYDTQIFGGSYLNAYGSQNVDLTAKIDNSNITIKGGTFSENTNIYGGGAIYNTYNYMNGNGREMINSVGKSTISITGATVKGDIYAGGLFAYGLWDGNGFTDNEGHVFKVNLKVGESEITVKDSKVGNIYSSNAFGQLDTTKGNTCNTAWVYTTNPETDEDSLNKGAGSTPTKLALINSTAKNIVIQQGQIDMTDSTASDVSLDEGNATLSGSEVSTLTLGSGTLNMTDSTAGDTTVKSGDVSLTSSTTGALNVQSGNLTLLNSSVGAASVPKGNVSVTNSSADSLSVDKGTLALSVTTTDNTVGTVKIGTLTTGSGVTVTASGDSAANDVLGGSLNKLLGQFEVNGKSGEPAGLPAGTQVILPESEIYGTMTGVIDENGYLTQTSEATNTKQDAYSSVNKASLLQWRHETNDLEKRMGELRDSAKGVGSWARVYGSEMEYGDQDLTTKNYSVQVGVDTDVPHNWKVGAAFNYTDSDTSYNHGSADGDSYVFSVYGTWLADNGLFVDLIGKYGRISTDFSLNGFDGSYDNNAWSMSAEAGWHWNVNGSVFLEPQLELTYGRVDGDSFRSAAGTKIEQDDFKSLVGRYGIRAGLTFPEHRGTIYARVTGAYEFKGDFGYTASNAYTSRSFDEDLDGSWVEYAIGANFSISDQAYTYLDLERSSCGDIDENWRWNVGFRYVW